MTRDEVLKRMLKKKPKQRKAMKPAPPKAVNPLDKIMDEDRVGYRKGFTSPWTSRTLML